MFAGKGACGVTCSVVEDLQVNVVVFRPAEMDSDSAFTVFREGVLNGIGDDLIDDQAQGHCLGDIQAYPAHVYDKPDLFRPDEAVAHIADDLADIGAHVDEGVDIRLIEFLMDNGDGLHALAAVFDS